MKPTSEFYRRSDRPRGFYSQCKACLHPNKCADCGTPVTARATFCLSCRSKGERNAIYGTHRPEHVKAAVSKAQTGVPEKRRGEAHQSWKGDKVSAKRGRGRANAMYPKPECCERCGERKRLDWHHIDENPLNNERTNLTALCRRCHQITDGRHDFLKSEMPRMGRRAQFP